MVSEKERRGKLLFQDISESPIVNCIPHHWQTLFFLNLFNFSALCEHWYDKHCVFWYTAFEWNPVRRVSDLDPAGGGNGAPLPVQWHPTRTSCVGWGYVELSSIFLWRVRVQLTENQHRDTNTLFIITVADFANGSQTWHSRLPCHVHGHFTSLSSDTRSVTSASYDRPNETRVWNLLKINDKSILKYQHVWLRFQCYSLEFSNSENNQRFSWLLPNNDPRGKKDSTSSTIII